MKQKRRIIERPQSLGFEYDSSSIRPTLARSYRGAHGWPSAVVAALLIIIVAPIVLVIGLGRRRR